MSRHDFDGHLDAPLARGSRFLGPEDFGGSDFDWSSRDARVADRLIEEATAEVTAGVNSGRMTIQRPRTRRRTAAARCSNVLQVPDDPGPPPYVRFPCIAEGAGEVPNAALPSESARFEDSNEAAQAPPRRVQVHEIVRALEQLLLGDVGAELGVQVRIKKTAVTPRYSADDAELLEANVLVELLMTRRPV